MAKFQLIEPAAGPIGGVKRSCLPVDRAQGEHMPISAVAAWHRRGCDELEPMTSPLSGGHDFQTLSPAIHQADAPRQRFAGADMLGIVVGFLTAPSRQVPLMPCLGVERNAGDRVILRHGCGCQLICGNSAPEKRDTLTGCGSGTRAVVRNS